MRIDNITAITNTVNNMGVVRLDKFNALARKIWKWAEALGIYLRTSYIPSRENKEADSLSID